ncbi:hypothetical protein ACF3N0_00330 [Moraxella atlantae]|uniref:hypothetical protein n=1 Tax=Faucicola atlantae TaxID=34059 RepID=UPI003751C119
MKLSLTIHEVYDAVAQYILSNGFPVDMNSADYELSKDGCTVSFDKLEEDKPKRKPRKTKEEKEEKVEITPKVESDGNELPFDELEEEVVEEEDIKESEEATNDFSLFS